MPIWGKMRRQHKLILSVPGLPLNTRVGGESELHPASFLHLHTFKIWDLPAGAGVGWFSFTYVCECQPTFALGNLTKQKVVLPVREIPSCFLGSIWRAKPLPPAHKKLPQGAGSSPCRGMWKYQCAAALTSESSREPRARVWGAGMYTAGWLWRGL